MVPPNLVLKIILYCCPPLVQAVFPCCLSSASANFCSTTRSVPPVVVRTREQQVAAAEQLRARLRSSARPASCWSTCSSCSRTRTASRPAVWRRWTTSCGGWPACKARPASRLWPGSSCSSRPKPGRRTRVTRGTRTQVGGPQGKRSSSRLS